MEMNDALEIKFSEPININTYSAAGGEGNITKRKIHHLSPNSKVFKSIDYLQYPDTALFYDKYEGITYNLYDELNSQISDHLRNIRKTSFFDHVYTNLLHHFYLTNQVLYDNNLRTLINKLFSNQGSIPIRRILKAKTKRTSSKKKESKRIVTPPRTNKKTSEIKISPTKKILTGFNKSKTNQLLKGYPEIDNQNNFMINTNKTPFDKENITNFGQNDTKMSI
jgi:hypothetical protein